MAEESRAVPHLTVRDLTPKQRRELGGIAAAGLASAVFFAVPFVQIIEPAPLAASPMALQMSVVADAPRALAVPLIRPSVAAAAPGNRRSAPLLYARHSSAVMALASTGPFRSSEPQADTSRTPRRITRLLFGSGRYRVQPFPMPAEQ